MTPRFDRSRSIFPSFRFSRPVRDRKREAEERGKDVAKQAAHYAACIRWKNHWSVSCFGINLLRACPPCSWHAVLPFARQGRYRKAGKDARKPVRCRKLVVVHVTKLFIIPYPHSCIAVTRSRPESKKVTVRRPYWNDTTRYREKRSPRDEIGLLIN